VTTAAELDTVLDAVAAFAGPQIAELITGGDVRQPDLFVGVNGDRGTLRYAGDDYPYASYSKNTGAPFELSEWAK
jgi:hypothetical protein